MEGVRVRITDVAARDGLQNEPGVIATAEKVRLVGLLERAGVDEVEVTSFVSPRWVPQLGDAEGVLEGLETPPPLGPLPTPGRGGGVRSVLVPNEKGFERALAFHQGGMPLKIAMFTAASETFSKKNTNASIAETIERFRPIVPRAVEAGMEMRFYVSCAVACPFEGAIAPGAVRRVVDQLLALVDDEDERLAADIDLGDTIGVAHPHEIEALLDEFDDAMREQVTLHLHDTFGRAASCVLAGLNKGIISFDGSAGGLGGCPYASTPQRRAPGNISTEVLVRTVHGAGFVTRVDPGALAEAGAYARGIVEKARANAAAGGGA